MKNILKIRLNDPSGNNRRLIDKFERHLIIADRQSGRGKESFIAIISPRVRRVPRVRNMCSASASICLERYLAPDIMGAVLEGRQPIELTPTRLLRLRE
jgi:hypothetical protein